LARPALMSQRTGIVMARIERMGSSHQMLPL
jgi:hypothetical protein